MVSRAGSWWRGGRKRHKSFSSTWMWVMVAVAVTEVVRGNRKTIYPGQVEYCPKNEGKPTVICTLNDRFQEYKMDINSDKEYTKVIINSEGQQVIIEKPGCEKTIEVVEIHDASRVTIGENPDRGSNCSVRLVLHDSRGADILRGVNLVRMESSEAHRVNLPRLSQLDLKNSTVGQVSVTIDGNKSTIEQHSEIKVVTKLMVNGAFTFQVKNSKFGRVEKFIYNNNNSNNELEYVEIDHVSQGSFIVNKGHLTLRSCTINTVESKGIVVNNGAKLTITNSKIVTFSQDSIYVKRNGFLSLDNVVVHGKNPISFSLSHNSVPMSPLKLLYLPPQPSTTWITLGVFFGLMVGGLTGVGIMCYLMKRRRYMNSDAETNKLLSLEPSPPRTDLGPPVNSRNFPPNCPLQNPVAGCSFPGQSNHPLPGMSSRPLPEVPGPLQNTAKNTAKRLLPDVPNSALQKPGNRPLPGFNDGEEEYEEYSDVVSGLDRNALRTAMAQGSSIPLGPKDERDALPPPPSPDDEELYDEVISGSSITPAPPPSGNKPAPPPSGNKPAPPPSGNKPAPPPSGNKLAPPPSGNKPAPPPNGNKPAPPPISRKPNPPPAAGKPWNL